MGIKVYFHNPEYSKVPSHGSRGGAGVSMSESNETELPKPCKRCRSTSGREEISGPARILRCVQCGDIFQVLGKANSPAPVPPTRPLQRRMVSLSTPCRCRSTKAVAQRVNQDFAVRCVSCRAFLFNASPQEYFSYTLITNASPPPPKNNPLPAPARPKKESNAPQYIPTKEPTFANHMRALALKVKLYETSEALTKPVAEAADRGRRPATFQQKQEWMRECLFYMEKNQYWREEDQERGRVLVQRLLRREELSLLEWDGVVELLRRYRDDVGSVPD
jgi:hypothetical protein